MDVGGTLTKIVYFEAKREEEPDKTKSKNLFPRLNLISILIQLSYLVSSKQPFNEFSPQHSPQRMTRY